MSYSSPGRAIEPFNLLQEGLPQTGSIYLPLLLLGSPTVVLSILQETLAPLTNGMTPLAGGLLFLSIPVSIVTVTTTAHFIYRYLRERTIDASGAFNKGIGTSLNAFMGCIIYIIAITVGFILLLLPGIYLSVAMGFFLCAMVSNNCSLFDSFNYSMNLVKGRWWPTFGSLLVASVFVIPLVIVTKIAGSTWNAPGSAMASIITNVASLFITPFLQVFQMKLYLRLQDTAAFNGK
jgi:hypothetical protein